MALIVGPSPCGWPSTAPRSSIGTTAFPDRDRAGAAPIRSTAPQWETDRIEARCYSSEHAARRRGAFLAASGYLGMLLLAWTLGPEDFGLYGVIITLLVWLERTTMLGIPSAVAKLVAEDEETAAPTSMLISVVLIGAVVTAIWVLAPTMARLLQAPGREQLFRLAALDVPSTGCTSCIEVWRWEGEFTVVFWSGVILGSARLLALAWILLAGHAISGA